MTGRIYTAACAIGVLLATGTVQADALSRLTATGNMQYGEEKYQEALKTYRNAQIESPEAPQLHYNIGNTLYKSSKYEDAITAYEKALMTDDAILQQQVHYNLGNTQFRQGESMMMSGDQQGLELFKQSIESYKKALELNPDDADAKYNIEYVHRKLKEMAQNSDQNQQQNKQQQNKQQQDQQNKKNQDDQQKQDQEQQQDGQQQQGEQDDKDKDDKEQQGQPQPKEGQMSEEDAKRILDAMQDDEKDLQKKLRRMPGKRGKVARDW